MSRHLIGHPHRRVMCMVKAIPGRARVPSHVGWGSDRDMTMRDGLEVRHDLMSSELSHAGMGSGGQPCLDAFGSSQCLLGSELT